MPKPAVQPFRIWSKRVTYIFPRIGISVTQLVVLDTDYRSILLVQIMEDVVAPAINLINKVRNACCCVKLWSGELAKRVEVHAVNGSDNEAENQLL